MDKRLNWLGFGLAALTACFADPKSPMWIPSVALAVIALVGNGFVLMKARAK